MLWTRHRQQKRDWISSFYTQFACLFRLPPSQRWIWSMVYRYCYQYRSILLQQYVFQLIDANVLFTFNSMYYVYVYVINIEAFWMPHSITCNIFFYVIVRTKAMLCKIFSIEIEGTNIIKFMAKHNQYTGDWYLACKQWQIFYDPYVCTMCVMHTIHHFFLIRCQNEIRHKKQHEMQYESILDYFHLLFVFDVLKKKLHAFFYQNWNSSESPA